MVMLVVGPQAGDTCVVDSQCDLRRPAGDRASIWVSGRPLVQSFRA